MKRSLNYFKNSKAWIERHRNDIYVKMSVKNDLRSRAIFKLEEIQEKYKLIQSSNIVLDLGAAPGGWSLAVSKLIKPNLGGKIISVDLLPFKRIDGVISIQGNFHSLDIKKQLKLLLNESLVDVILSDMLHNTTGNKELDHFKSMEIVHDILNYSNDMLKKNGILLCKYLRGSDEKELIERIKTLFDDYKIIKPKASRQESSEMYVLCLRKK